VRAVKEPFHRNLHRLLRWELGLPLEAIAQEGDESAVPACRC